MLHGVDWAASPWDKEGDYEKKLITKLGHHHEDPPTFSGKLPNINVLELWPIVVAIMRWGEHWKDMTICMVTDNMQVMYGLRTGKSINPISMEWLRWIFWQCVTKNLQIKSVYIKNELNVVCDSLSRLDKPSSATRIKNADKEQVMCCSRVFDYFQSGSN